VKRTFFKSIYFKNFFGIALLLFMVFIFFGISFTSISYRMVVNEKKESMLIAAEETSDIVAAYDVQWDLGSFEVRMALTAMERTTGFHYLLSDNEGKIVASSDREFHSRYIGREIPEEIIGNIDQHKQYSGVTRIDTVYDDVRYIVGMPVVSPLDGENSGYILLSSNASSMMEMWRDFAGIFISVAIIVLIVSFVVSYITTRKQARPIKEMAAAAHKFARGDFKTRVNEEGRRDEIGELADAFNVMADSLERSENLRSEFVANVSHELKTPMTTIQGFADGILDGTIPPERQEKYLRIISSETKRLSRLVKSMLEMSHIQTMDTNEVLSGRFDVAEVVRVAIVSLEKKVNDRGLDIDAVLPEDSVITRGNKDSITQVVYNLIDNAIKFSDAGSTVKIELWKQGGNAFVSVENTGETIKEEDLSAIFDRFNKSDKSRSVDKDGVGLGLYIVKTILDNHNENIFVTSKDGVTRFVFTLTLI